jgi:hypothetical protein
MADFLQNVHIHIRSHASIHSCTIMPTPYSHAPYGSSPSLFPTDFEDAKGRKRQHHYLHQHQRIIRPAHATRRCRLDATYVRTRASLSRQRTRTTTHRETTTTRAYTRNASLSIRRRARTPHAQRLRARTHAQGETTTTRAHTHNVSLSTRRRARARTHALARGDDEDHARSLGQRRDAYLPLRFHNHIVES